MEFFALLFGLVVGLSVLEGLGEWVEGKLSR